MRSSEKGWLALGLMLGLIFAVAVYAFQEHRRRGLEPVATESAAAATPETGSASSIQLTEGEQKAIGVETVAVKRHSIREQTLTLGRVEEPETGITIISARVSGRIDKLFLNVTGESVNVGQPVALIYSRDIVAGMEEYKLALDNRRRLTESKEPQAIAEADELIRASRRRLELRGLTAQQIDDYLAASENTIHFTMYSPTSGVVAKRNVTEGQYVNEGDVLYTVTDLRSVWVQADIPEADIPIIRRGQAAQISGPSLSGGPVRGVVSFLQPSIDPQKRTMTARIQVTNAQMRLLPGMFVQVSFDAPLGNEAVAVPRSAVLETGLEKVVYVAKENGIFEKRTIEASIVGDEYYGVTKGVAAGERVVTKGNFLIDSQTRLSGNITGMFGGSKAFGSDTTAPAGPKYTITLRQEPAVPKGAAEGEFHVALTDPEGKPVSDAQVQITLVMPAMPSMGMAEMRSAIHLNWNGSEYIGSGTIAMAGPWNVAVEARRGGQLVAVYRSRFDAK
jgi:Cu(I)/Ag(I) efflux system membrane fusion protein